MSLVVKDSCLRKLQVVLCHTYPLVPTNPYGFSDVVPDTYIGMAIKTFRKLT